MCGILGFYTPALTRERAKVLDTLLKKLFLLSESRGKEASGLVLADSERIQFLREPLPARGLLRTSAYAKIINDFFTAQSAPPTAAIGHTRLVTNGFQDCEENNQPVSRDGIVLVHNGIILNDQQIWSEIGQRPVSALDSEVIAADIAYARSRGADICTALGHFFGHAQGNASLALLAQDDLSLYLVTNNSSLYLVQTKDIVFFASERRFLAAISKDVAFRQIFDQNYDIVHLKNLEVIKCSTQGQALQLTKHSFSSGSSIAHERTVKYRKIENISQNYEEARKNMRRCTRCILPETMPFIQFDEQGVCNYCHNYKPMPLSSKEAALDALQSIRACNQNDANSLFMLSGGRDSCYGLHYAVRELGLKPIAYTYDWGMVTDIARRNTARMCGVLGIEHVLVSADIAWKRANVRKNLLAWLHKPELGMIPLFMAGDKQYFYYAERVRRENALPVTLVAENPLEATRFKAGFCGVDESGHRIFNIPLRSKLKLLFYYARRYLTNHRYFNSTLFDNAFAFSSSYLIRHDLFHLFSYIRWDEQSINFTLQDGYGWETDPESHSTWRIGDGTAAFYNYAYYVMAGFTENDTLRSNQIREGMLERETAFSMVELENKPRWKSLEWYASTIGFNLEEALLAINRAPKLYC